MTETTYTDARIRRLELDVLQRDARIRELESALFRAETALAATEQVQGVPA